MSGGNGFLLIFDYETTQSGLCGHGRPAGSFAQGSSRKEQLVGTWTMVSNVNFRPDGSRYEALGRNPRGVFILDANGHFAITIIGEARPIE